MTSFLSWPFATPSGKAPVLIYNSGMFSYTGNPGCGTSYRVKMLVNFAWQPGVTIPLLEIMKEIPRVLVFYSFLQPGLKSFVMDNSGNHNHAILTTTAEQSSSPSWTDYESQSSPMRQGLRFEQGQFLKVPMLNITSGSFFVSFWFQHKAGSDCVLAKVLGFQNSNTEELMRIFVQTSAGSPAITIKVRVQNSAPDFTVAGVGVVLDSWQMLFISCVDVIGLDLLQCSFVVTVSALDLAGSQYPPQPTSTVLTSTS